MAKLIGADALLILTDIDGLYDQDPNQYEYARIIPEVKEITESLFEIAGVRYVGVGVIASSVGMDKTFTKIIFKDAGIPQANWVVIAKHEMPSLDEKIAEIEKTLPEQSLALL